MDSQGVKDVESEDHQCDSDDASSSSISSVGSTCALLVPLPTSRPFSNFYQNFKLRHKRSKVSLSECAKLASVAWKELSEEQKAPFKSIAATVREMEMRKRKTRGVQKRPVAGKRSSHSRSSLSDDSEASSGSDAYSEDDASSDSKEDLQQHGPSPPSKRTSPSSIFARKISRRHSVG